MGGHVGTPVQLCPAHTEFREGKQFNCRILALFLTYVQWLQPLQFYTNYFIES